MAGEPELTGLAKHFNSVTHTGRANVAKATYAAIFMIWGGMKLKGYMAEKK